MRKRFIILPSIIIGGLAFSSYSWLQSPNTGTVVAGNSNGTVLGTETSLSAWNTSYFTTKNPSYLQVKSTSESINAPIMGSYLLTSLIANDTDQVGVTIGSLGNDPLADISAIKLRQNQPTQYEPTTKSYAPEGAIAFTSNNGTYETDLFWQHETQYAAVVVSGSASRQTELEQDLQTIVSNWQWN